MISITDIAKEKIEEVLQSNPGKYLRIVIDGFGWGGPRLGLALDELNDSEAPVQVNGLEVLISDKVKGFADGSMVDYTKSSYGEGFTIRNSKSSC